MPHVAQNSSHTNQARCANNSDEAIAGDMMMRRTFLGVAAALLMAGLPHVASAQGPAGAYPNKLVRIVIPFPPGGGVDIMVRAVGAELSKRWGQPIIVDNKAGGGTLIGADAAARAPADGYTLFATVNQTITSNRFLYKKLPYDPDASFIPVIEMVESEQLIVANPKVPAKDLREFVAYAKSESGKVAYGSFGAGTQPHLAFSLMAKREGADLLHVPYKGIAEVMTAVVSGEIAVSTGSGSVAGQLIQGGKLKPLAIASRQRSPLFPNVPTVQEQGFGYLTASIWYGLFAPAGTPAAIVEKINADVRDVLRDPAFAQVNATARNLKVVAGTPQEFQTVIREEVKQVAEMIRVADVKPE